MAHGLVRQHPGHHTAEDDGLFSGVRVDALAFFHDVPIQLVDFYIQRGGIGKVLPEAALAARHGEELHRHAGRGLRRRALGDAQQLLHGVLVDHDPAADEVLVPRGDTGVQRPGEVEIGALRRVVEVRVRGEGPAVHGGERPAVFPHMPVHEISVFRRGPQNGPGCLGGVFRHGREAVHAVFIDPGADAGTVRADVLDEVPGQQDDAARAVFLSAKLGMGAVGKERPAGGEDVFEHIDLLVIG